MSVTAASGFLAYGLAAGLKSSGSKDLAPVINTGPDYAAAGVFTTNRVKAAPVVWSEQVLKGGHQGGVQVVQIENRHSPDVSRASRGV